jgi:hypothetical protein
LNFLSISPYSCLNSTTKAKEAKTLPTPLKDHFSTAALLTFDFGVNVCVCVHVVRRTATGNNYHEFGFFSNYFSEPVRIPMESQSPWLARNIFILFLNPFVLIFS